MNVKIVRCAVCDKPIEDDDWEEGDEPELCGVCNLIDQETN